MMQKFNTRSQHVYQEGKHYFSWARVRNHDNWCSSSLAKAGTFPFSLLQRHPVARSGKSRGRPGRWEPLARQEGLQLLSASLELTAATIPEQFGCCCYRHRLFSFQCTLSLTYVHFSHGLVFLYMHNYNIKLL